MISTASLGAVQFQLSAEAPVAMLLPSLQGRRLPAAPARPLAREATPVGIIDISDDNEETDWDLLQGESDEENQVSAETMATLTAKEEAGNEREKPPPVTSSDSSSSSNSLGAGNYIDLRNGRPQMRRICSPIRGPCRGP